MPTESLQLLTPWAFNEHGVYIRKPDGSNYGIKGFAHHPCMKWLYESPSNAWWLLSHAVSMSEEYTRRYNKQHGVSVGLDQLSWVLLRNHKDSVWQDHTEFVQAMPDEFKVPGDPIQAYRNYLNGYKGYAEWRYCQKPTWWDEAKHEPVRAQYLAEREARRLKRKHGQHSRVQTSLQSERDVRVP